MIGRQHRCEGADVMGDTGCDAFDAQNCLRKLFSRLSEMKGRVSRVRVGYDPSEVEVFLRQK